VGTDVLGPSGVNLGEGKGTMVFSRAQSTWHADVVRHEGQNGKNKAPNTVAMANMLDPIQGWQLDQRH